MGEAFGWSELRIEAAVAVDTVSCSVVAGIGAFTVAAVAGTAVATVVGTAVAAVVGTAVVVAGIGAFNAAAVVDFRIRLALCGSGSVVGWAQRSNSLGSAPAHCKSPLSSPDS